MIYVDRLANYPVNQVQLSARKYGNTWCHIWTDGPVEELVAFAQAIGLKEQWLQDSETHSIAHFDLLPSKRKRAIKNGAVEMSYRDYLQKLRNKEKV